LIMKMTSRIAATFIALAVIASTAILRADDASPKYTVEQIMKAVFKGQDSIAKKISKGNGTKEDYDKLVEYVSSLPLNDAPQGDPTGWKKKTTALLEAATALKEGKPGALAQYNQAVNCQACHSLYRPE
jgi:cytochrome c556